MCLSTSVSRSNPRANFWSAFCFDKDVFGTSSSPGLSQPLDLALIRSCTQKKKKKQAPAGSFQTFFFCAAFVTTVQQHPPFTLQPFFPPALPAARFEPSPSWYAGLKPRLLPALLNANIHHSPCAHHHHPAPPTRFHHLFYVLAACRTVGLIRTPLFFFF